MGCHGFTFGRGFFGFVLARFLKVQNHGCRDEYRRERAHRNTYKERECKSTQYLTAKDQQNDYHQESRTRRNDRTGKGFVDGVIEYPRLVLRCTQVDVFPDTVEDDHSIVDRVPNDRQDCGYKHLVDLKGNSKKTCDRECGKHEQRVVNCRYNGAGTELPGSEAHQDVKENTDQRK